MIHSSRVAISGGTLAETFGTAVDIDLPSNAKKIIAIVNSGADPTTTTAEGAAQILRVNSDSLSLVNQQFPVSPYLSSGPSTNNDGSGSVATIIPVAWGSDQKPVKGATISIDIAPTAAVTVAFLHETALLWEDFETPTPQDWNLKFPNIVPVVGGQLDAAQQLTTTRTALAALTIPSWIREIVGFKAGMVKEGAITASEEILGFIEMTSSIPSISPLDIPVLNATGGSLGTPAGGHGIYFDDIPWLPIYIKGTGKQETITPFINMRTAVTTGNNVFVAVAYR